MNTVENTVKKLNEERKVYATKLKRLTAEYLNKIEPTVMAENGKVNLIQEILYGLDDEEIRSFAGKKISAAHEKTIVLIVHVSSYKEENASVVFARTQPLGHIDCNKLFNRHSSLGAKGGGKPNFVTGVINKEKADEFMRRIIADIMNIL